MDSAASVSLTSVPSFLFSLMPQSSGLCYFTRGLQWSLPVGTSLSPSLYHCQTNILEHGSNPAHKCSVTCSSSSPWQDPLGKTWHSRSFLTGANLDFPGFPDPSLKQTNQTGLIILNYIHQCFFSHINIYSFQNSNGYLFGINNVSYSLSEQKPNVETTRKGTAIPQTLKWKDYCKTGKIQPAATWVLSIVYFHRKEEQLKISPEKIDFFDKWHYGHCGHLKQLDPYLTFYTKIDLKWTKNLNN